VREPHDIVKAMVMVVEELLSAGHWVAQPTAMKKRACLIGRAIAEPGE